MVEVYVLISIVNMGDSKDEFGNNTGIHESIQGIYDTIEAAEKRKEELEQLNVQDENDCSCVPTEYRIDTWTVNSGENVCTWFVDGNITRSPHKRIYDTFGFDYKACPYCQKKIKLSYDRK